jgi:hypothetical protein
MCPQNNAKPGPAPEDQFGVDPAVDLAEALRTLVNAPLPADADPERPFWRACRNARATLSLWQSRTGVDGELD